MKLTLIQVPYHLGRAQIGVGLGPVRYLEAAADQMLSGKGFDVTVEMVEREEPFLAEPRAIVAVNARLAKRVQDAVGRGSFPIVLAGDCNTCLGTLVGLEPSSVGIIWFDAHADFNTPETSPSGFLDGMALAVATGHCYDDLRTRIGQNAAIQESRVLLVGTRDLDPQERERLEASAIRMVTAGEMTRRGIAPSLLPRLAELQSEAREVYLHLDIDVMDPREAPGVDFRCPRGVSSADVGNAVRMIAEQFRIRAAALTAYNPAQDKQDTTLRAGLYLLNSIAAAVAESSGRA